MKLIKDTAPMRANIDALPGRRRESFPSIQDEWFWELYAKSSPFSLLHVTGFYNLFQSMNYIHENKVPGDIAECGCYYGGAAIFIALMRQKFGMRKKIYLFDSFEGFPPGEVDNCRGQPAKSITFPNILNDVRENLMSVLSNLDGIELIQGFVENTLPHPEVNNLCLLRLDTDFYNSTKVELETLYPALVRGGVLIVDDYGQFAGSRRATDAYFDSLPYPPLLNRIDEGVWAGVKP